MTKDRVVHYRLPTAQCACNHTMKIAHVHWSLDAKDVTCDKCLKTNEYKQAASG